MNAEQAQAFLIGITGNWPYVKMPEETLELWASVLATLTYDEAIATLWGDFGDSEFPPAPLHLSKRALSRRRPAVSAEELVAELQSQIANVGYTGVPTWSHPALEEFVRREGGWTTVCSGAWAPNAPDYGTYYAQARNLMRVLIERTEEQPSHAALGAGPLEELE